MIGREMAKKLLGKTAAALGAFAAGVGKAGASLAAKAGPVAARLAQNFTQVRLMTKKKQAMIFIAGGLLVLFLTLLVTALATAALRPGEAAPANARAAYAIPAGELFIPDEPDFIPGILLGRGPRQSWSLEDIRPYWRAPENPEFWQGVLRTAVDGIMEHIP